MKRKILVIEDDLSIRETLSDLFSIAGYEVDGAPNGKMALSKVQIDKPDIIVCDIMMPEMDGFETYHEMQKLKGMNTIPFVFLTSSADKNSMRKAMNLGVSDFITKPFCIDEVLNVVKIRILKSKEIKNENADELNSLKQRVNKQSKKIHNYAFVNSHMLRGPVARILGLMDLINNHNHDLEDRSVFQLLNGACTELDQVVFDISRNLEAEEENKIIPLT